jgi:hypothetical protein
LIAVVVRPYRMMPFASPERKREYMRDYMRRRRAQIPKKVRAYSLPRPKPTDSSLVHCDHCQRYIPLADWGKGEHAPVRASEEATA